MPTFTMTKNWDDGTALTESQLDDIKNSTETFLNTTKIDADNIQDSGITTAKIASGAVTQAKRASLGHQLSSSSGAYSTTSTSYGDVTNLSVTITTTGRPVYVALIADGTSNVSGLESGLTASDVITHGRFKLLRDATSLLETDLFQEAGSSPIPTSNGQRIPVSSINYIDVVSSGTYVYKLQGKVVDSNTILYVNYAKLIAYEL